MLRLRVVITRGLAGDRTSVEGANVQTLLRREHVGLVRERTSTAPHYPGHRSRCPERHPRGRPLPTRISYQHLIYIWNIQIQQLQQTKIQRKTNETLKISVWNTCENVWHLKTITNICNIQMKHSQTYVRNALKYLKHMLVTCMYI
jgi:hypothetical protein